MPGGRPWVRAPDKRDHLDRKSLITECSAAPPTGHVPTFLGMKRPKDPDKRSEHQHRPSDRDGHGTKIERVPGPGPNDAGKGAAGKEAKDRLERKGS